MDRTHGERLLSLDCDLIWATAWMHHANEVEDLSVRREAR